MKATGAENSRLIVQLAKGLWFSLRVSIQNYYFIIILWLYYYFIPEEYRLDYFSNLLQQYAAYLVKYLTFDIG